MSSKTTSPSNTKSRQHAKIASIFSLIAFVGVMGLTAVSVFNISSTIENKILSNKNGVPTAWNNYTAANLVDSATTAKVVNNDYVEYTSYIKNEDSNNVYTLTHISSYISEEDTAASGFAPLDDQTLEYSYTPSDPNSWQSVSISAPKNDAEEGFKLNTNLQLGYANTGTDTVYFRYNVSPAAEGTITDTVSFVAEDVSGSASLATSDSEVSFAKTSNANQPGQPSASSAAASSSSASSDDSDSSYAQPLGVFSDSPNTDIISASSLGVISIPKESLSISIGIVVVALVIFVASLIIYLIVRNKPAAAPKNSVKQH